jgi:cell division protein FtsI (penicillin-binding protein 3)
VPTEVKDLPTAVSLITRITGEDHNVVLADCRNHKTFCWVARKADDETIERIKSLNLQGIHFQKEPKRFYPARDLAAQVVGTVGMEDGGQSGIEHAFDEELRGRAGKMFISVDARRQWFSDVEKQPEPGENLVLTIDKNIQYIAEKELDQAIHDTQAIAGTVIVENPHTGEILALANRPTFNPNLRKQITPGALTNRAVSYVYEPGSTFKLVTISAALEEKLTNPNEVFDCQMGSIVYNGMRIRDSKPHGLLPVWGVLAESSDVGAIKIALRLGEDRFYKYIRAYGFGQQTGIELPGETRGLTKPVSRWSKVSIAAISMGQEIGISPIQLSALISTFANDGVWVAPRIVAGKVEPQGTPQTVAFHPGDSHRVISSYTAGEMRSMMQKVVLEGTGRKAILEGYSSAGKTGTAQKVDPATGAYSKTKYIGSFAGFAPVNNPRFRRRPASGRASIRAGIPSRHAAGFGVSAYAARFAAGAETSVIAGPNEDERERPRRRDARPSGRTAGNSRGQWRFFGSREIKCGAGAPSAGSGQAHARSCGQPTRCSAGVNSRERAAC